MKKIAIIGLGYVGLPLAVEFGKKRATLGFDIDSDRVKELTNGIDKTSEVSSKEMAEAKDLTFSHTPDALKSCDIFIVTVPTPVDASNIPDLKPLINASQMLGEHIKKGDIIIYESTVYPGATEEVCIPTVESISGLQFNTDFFVGYSPERINPGDKKNRLPTIKKITSGSTPAVAQEIDELYNEIITAGTHKASSIKVAEAAKVIENTQRDLNIAFVNELSIIFSHLDIDTSEVLEAAMTKWNFLPFQPGLVGGHCISVDPYYLTHKSQSSGYIPDMILSARRINNEMPAFIVDRMIKAMLKKRIHVDGSKILILGFTFKENCPDIRNTKVADVAYGLATYGANIDVYDPLIDLNIKKENFDINFINSIDKQYDGIILAVPHNEFMEMGTGKILAYAKENNVFFDMKSVFEKSDSDLRL